MKTLALILLSLAAALPAQLRAQEAAYAPLPAGFDHPADAATLLAAVRAGDEAALRAHAWQVFAGLTQPARPADPGGQAVWETWYSADELFAPETPAGPRDVQRPLKRPARTSLLHGMGKRPDTEPTCWSFALFNAELRDHTRANRLYAKATLRALDASWTAQTPVAERRVPEYPVGAISLKAVWWLVKEHGMTALPVWDEQPRTLRGLAQSELQWKRRVAVDPTRDVVPADETTDLSGFPRSRVVPLSAFHHVTLDARLAATLPGAAAGDHLALVGLHYATKEIPDWVWATFWWHDRPADGPYAQGRPDDARLRGAWRSYLMDSAYDMELPREADRTPNAVVNPWLEARFLDGVNSNCMTCHQRAVWSPGAPAPSFKPITRGATPPDDPLFRGGTTTDYLWSLLLEGNR